MASSHIIMKSVSICLLWVFLSPVVTGTIHVPADYSTIQGAIDASVNGDTIIVSLGTYYENINFNGKNIILTSTEPEDPSIVESTIINGGQNGSVVSFSGSETSACRLRGFTITNGSAGQGGGIYVSGIAAPIISHCILENNEASLRGGGVFAAAHPVIRNCTFANNKVGSSLSGGGGLYSVGNTTVSNCLFIDNTSNGSGGAVFGGNLQLGNTLFIGNEARQNGGAIWAHMGTNYIVNCTVVNNFADEAGGGIYVYDSYNTIISNCIICDNNVGDSSKQISIYYATATISHSNIENGQSGIDYTGACTLNWGLGNIDSNSLFVDISAAEPTNWNLHLLPNSPCIDAGTNSPPGGLPETDIEGTARPFDGDYDSQAVADMGVYEFDLSVDESYLYIEQREFVFSAFESWSNPEAQNVTIQNLGNQSSGTLNWSLDLTSKPDWLLVTPTSGSLGLNESEPVTLSVDITGLSGQYSYAFDVYDPAALNSPQSLSLELEVIEPIFEVSATSFSYIRYEGDPNPDPRFFTVSNLGGGTVNWSLDLTCKPDWLAVTPTSGSLEHNEDEPVTLSVDMTGLAAGYYSYGFDVIDSAAQNNSQTIMVNLYNGDRICLNGMPYPTIQAAIDAATTDPNFLDTIIVAPGTYFENINFHGKYIILTSIDPADPNIVENTIINGGKNGSVVTFSGSETSACQLRGFTITNGYAYAGGGICGGEYIVRQTHAMITNCIIIDNTADYGAGLLYCDGPITNCAIARNTASYDSGGLRGCNGAITNCTIVDNIAGHHAGGLNICDGSISNCTITGNTASYGGGLYLCDGPITNCIITGNTVSRGGGGLYSCGGPITNCTIAGNTAGDVGGGLSRCWASIMNCIVWGNSAGIRHDQIYYSSIPSYSCIQNWTSGGIGNISNNPLFADMSLADPTLWDLHLLPISPCIDRGTNSSPGGLPFTDFEGDPRLFDGDFDGLAVADIGAYEFNEVPEEPYLSVTPRLLSFSAIEMGDNPSDQTLTIQNRGNQVLNWSLDLTGKPDWLSVTPTSGALELGERGKVTLSVNITGLSRGQNSYSCEVVDLTALNSLQTMLVEVFIGKVIYVDDDGPHDPGPYDPNISDPLMEGSSEHPFDNIQEGIDVGIHGDIIVVLPGTYYEHLFFNGNNIVLTSTEPTNRNIVETTIIQGAYHLSVVNFTGTENSMCKLEGFTITNGDSWYGGGIWGNQTQATISNCVIADNTGSGLYGCDGAITNCIIIENTHGAGVDCDGLIANCTITGNICGSWGGGLYMCNGTITNCTITGNSAGWDGGGLYRCSGTITNCTIAGNTAGDDGGGFGSCLGRISNCIIWGNNDGERGDQIYASSIPVYSYIQGWPNIDPNYPPEFVDSDDGDYHLKSEYGRWDSSVNQWVYDDVTSPCIDAGMPEGTWDDNGTPSDPNDDLFIRDPKGLWANELWPHGGRINMGAYGGTPQASMSGSPVGNAADLDHDDAVGISDFLLFSEDWLMAKYLRDTDLNRDGLLDIADFAEFANQWLWTESQSQ